MAVHRCIGNDGDLCHWRSTVVLEMTEISVIGGESVKTFTNNFWACQSSSFTDIRLICSVFVEFMTSFFQVCFNCCVAAMDARLGFRTRLRWFCDRTFCGSFGLQKRCGLTLLGCPMSTVIRVTLTAILLRCPWPQRFFDI